MLPFSKQKYIPFMNNDCKGRKAMNKKKSINNPIFKFFHHEVIQFF